MSRDEFWRCQPAELWWLVDAHRPTRMYGSMTEQEVDDLIEMMQERGYWQ